MTTWHENETLDEALDFFVRHSRPDEGFESASDYWLAISMDNPGWSATIEQYLEDRFG